MPTPLGPRPLQQQVVVASTKALNLNIKVINPHKKSEYETYVLHDMSSHNITTPDCLKKEILRQLGPDIVSPNLNFPVGYTKSTNKLWIKSGSDIMDV